MNPEEDKCPLCEKKARRLPEPEYHNFSRYTCPLCGDYYICYYDQLAFLGNAQRTQNLQPKRITALLQERRNKKLRTPVLQFTSQSYPDIPDTVPLPVRELLATWPETVPEKIDRCLCNLIYAKSYAVPGQDIEIWRQGGNKFLFFTDLQFEEDYYIEAMLDYGWVEEPRVDECSTGRRYLLVTPKGWAKFDELTRGSSNVKNPAFVAMWFGGDQRKEKEKMTELFDSVISAAIKKAGYLARRADTDEHNEPIMDRVVAYIREAPFVVAELSDDNRGVYYEAGFARGCGIEVIHCCREGSKVHFDLSGVNQVKWEAESDLQEKLEARILGTLDKGPYSFDEDNTAKQGV